MKKIFDFKKLDQIQEELSLIKSSTEALEFLNKYNFPLGNIDEIGTKEKLEISFEPAFLGTDHCFTISIIHKHKGTIIKLNGKGKEVENIFIKTKPLPKAFKIKNIVTNSGNIFKYKRFDVFLPRLKKNVPIVVLSNVGEENWHFVLNENNMYISIGHEEDIEIFPDEQKDILDLLSNIKCLESGV